MSPAVVVFCERSEISIALQRVLNRYSVPCNLFNTQGMVLDFVASTNLDLVLFFVGINDELVSDTCRLLPGSNDVKVVLVSIDSNSKFRDGPLAKIHITELLRTIIDTRLENKDRFVNEYQLERKLMIHQAVEKEVSEILGSPILEQSSLATFKILEHKLINAFRDSGSSKNPDKCLAVADCVLKWANVKQLGTRQTRQEMSQQFQNEDLVEFVKSVQSISKALPGTSLNLESSSNAQSSGQPQIEVVVLFVDDREEELDWFENQFRESSLGDPDEFFLTVKFCQSFEEADKIIRGERNCQAVIFDSNLSQDTRGRDCVLELRKEFPNLLYCVMTRGNPLKLVSENDWPKEVRVFQKDDPTSIASLYQTIINSISRRSSTPFFSALKEYSQRPVSVFHAQITSGGNSLRKSIWLGRFYDFYGEEVFNGETTTTVEPLDSLLEPKGSIKSAQELAAKAFGARRTFFVTNGTSTAVKILYQGLLKPGDIVLIDRCCHKSHHYGLVLSGANPAYLKSEPLNLKDENGTEFGTGIWKGVRVEEVIASLEKYPDAKMLSLTNCTFDGYIHQAEQIVSSIIKKLRELYRQGKRKSDPNEFVFLFDEAWFAYAAFLPYTRRYTAMAVSQKYQDARIYSVQSTHKTLSAFRQGSMIHSSDPHLDRDGIEFQQLKEALFTHTTTSPSYNMLASLDAGRMQADMEGGYLWTEAWNLAAEFREIVSNDTELSKYFGVLDADDMDGVFAGSQIDDREWALDKSKITLLLKPFCGLTGPEARRVLLQNHDVHFNKTTNNTCLLMINGGSTNSSVAHLVQALRDLTRVTPKPVKSVPPIGNELLDTSFFLGPKKQFGLRDHFFGLPDMDSKTIRLDINEKETLSLAEQGVLYSRLFVIPYPPGFPVLVPGQFVSPAVVEYLRSLSVKEIHGMNKTQLTVVKLD